MGAEVQNVLGQNKKFKLCRIELPGKASTKDAGTTAQGSSGTVTFICLAVSLPITQ